MDEKKEPEYLGNRVIYQKIVVDFLIAIAVFLFLIFVIPRSITFFLPFFIGWIIALIANPLVRFLENHVKIVRKHGSVLVICAAIAAVVAILYFGGIFLVRQVIGLIKDLPELYATMLDVFSNAAANLAGIMNYLPDGLQEAMDNIQSNLISWAGGMIKNMSAISFDHAGSMVKNVAEGFLIAIFTILSSYFFVAEKEKISETYRHYMPESVINQIDIVKENFVKALGGYFKAQLKIMMVVIVILFAGFELLRVDYSFLLGLGVAVLDFLPFFGTGTVLFPWALVDVINGNYFRAVCLILLYFICQVVRQILQPKIVGDSIGLSPMATLFFMFVGYRIKGVLGMILGIPIGMAIINLYRAGLFHQLIRGLQIIVHDINEFRKY